MVKKTRLKKGLGVVLSLMLALASFQTVAFADETDGGEEETSGEGEGGTDYVAEDLQKTKFTSIQDAIEHAYGDIKLLCDVDENVTVDYDPDGVTPITYVTIDLNGNVWTPEGDTNASDYGDSIITVTSNAYLTIKDSSTSAQHKFTIGSNGLWTLDETN